MKTKAPSRASNRATNDLDQLLGPAFEDERQANRQFVTALARGLEVLAVFDPSDGLLSNQEIAARAELPRPTVSRITYTLTKLGYLEYVADMERYRLGTGVLALGYAFRAGLEIRKLARPHMEEFVRNTGVTVAMCAPFRLSFILLDIASDAGSMRLMLDVGSRIKVADTPATAAFLEAIPQGDERLIAELAHETAPDAWDSLQPELERCRKEVRERGFCVFSSSLAKNVNVCATTMLSPARDKTFVFEAWAHDSEIDRTTFYDKVGPALIHMTEMIRGEAGNWRF